MGNVNCYEWIGGSLTNTMLSFYWAAQESLGTGVMRGVGGIRILCTADIKGQRDGRGEESGIQRWILREE